ncbi:MAG TPA: NADP-dependent oxidoreductase [Thermoplasmata archaeon]|nr:NADP-dependent oxidoreductase [Thermoplasmata archaeon]
MGPIGKGPMPAGINRQWLVAKRSNGAITEDCFRWAESSIPSPGEGQFLARNLWYSFDPTQLFLLGRGIPQDEAGGAIPIGQPMTGLAVSKVLESRHPKFRAGDIVHGSMGWEDYSVSDGSGFIPTYRVPDGVSPNWAVGALGITGLVAYFGVHEVARPKPGETFVISGAAGGVGTIAAQVAKIHGLRVIGIAGSSAKCDWLVREAGIDASIDYRKEDVGKRLTELCPDGIDIYFDNVGGPTLDLALQRLRQGGRVVLCGITSLYAVTGDTPGPPNYYNLIMVNGRMEGLLGRDYIPRIDEAVTAMLPLLQSGRLKAKEDLLQGLRSAPSGLARLYSGAGFGKQLLQMDDPPPA